MVSVASQRAFQVGAPGERAGVFRYDVREDRWWWSDEIYAVHGYGPGEVPPTMDVLLAHKYEEDRAYAAESLKHCLVNGEPFGCYHRIVDASGVVRRVVMTGDGDVAEDGSVTALRGFFVDVTESVEKELRTEAGRSIATARASQEEVDQARGMLMAVYGIDADAAFQVLRCHSQHANVKLRDVANALVAAAPTPAGDPAGGMRRRVERVLYPESGCGP